MIAWPAFKEIFIYLSKLSTAFSFFSIAILFLTVSIITTEEMRKKDLLYFEIIELSTKLTINQVEEKRGIIKQGSEALNFIKEIK